MSNRRRTTDARHARRPSGPAKSNAALTRGLLLIAGILLIGGLAALVVLRGGSSDASPAAADAADSQLARDNAGGAEVRVLSGSRHTVYHATAPLPTESTPTSDGRPVLVWFSGTWCDFCERMEPFAHATASQFRDRLVFVEKSVDHDRSAAARYAVRGTPTFVLIDPTGRELARFGFQPTAEAFAAAIEAALQRAS
ncbi:thioredoxin family protein [Tepidiforma sp.]|uniref:thioredoxin family protein n=1 Tax=Tepidiforma sp. TaxID=2682230 RepID=UPI002ADE8A85|nr:thioredoxin family protein [Tepidiforma sp.]